MKKIGIIGEDPNDTTSIKNLLVKKYPHEIKCKTLIRNIKGGHLDNARTPKSLKVEFDDYNPDVVIFVRDADGIATEQQKIKKVKDWFNKLNPVVNNRGILLHNIYELEALILADIATFNKLYKTDIKVKSNVMYQKEPKELLIRESKKIDFKNPYKPSDCEKIFNTLDFDTVLNNCEYFRAFNAAFAERLL